jgi:hypothetical protein
MALRRRKSLGLAIEERSILAAEVRMAGARPMLDCAAEFAFPEGLSLDNPEPLGQALRDFLHKNGFSAKHAVIGIPARWLLAKDKEFPPAGQNALAGMVRLEAESSFATDLDELMVDYANGAGSTKGGRVLVTAIARQKADQLLTMAQAAELKPKALVPTSLVLSAALRPRSASLLTLSLRPNHVELVVRSAGRFQALKHLSATTSGADWKQDLAGELRRLTMLLPRAEGTRPPDELVICDGAGLDAASLKRLGEDLAVPTVLSDGVATLGIAPAGREPAEGHRFTPAAALALAGARGEQLPVDFLHSHLVETGTTKAGRRIALAAAAVGVVLAATALLYADWRSDKAALASLKQQYEAMKPQIDTARQVVDQTTLAAGWYDQRPKFLDCLHELTLAFPVEGRIWVTSLAMREDMRVAVTGGASDQRTVLETLDQIRKNPAFADVTVLYVRDTAGASREVAFSVTLLFANRK